ncbi:MAG: ABC transporter permease [Lachnospiraceae bacterium]|nr:ABC transporter permease [Lachnospiraceae bacterium]
MKSNLSAWKYVKNNRRSVATMISALALSFAVIYIVHVLLMTSVEGFKPMLLEFPKKVGFFSLSEKTLEKSKVRGAEDGDPKEKMHVLLDTLRTKEGVKDITWAQVLQAQLQAVIGMWSEEFPLYTSTEEIERYLDHTGAKLVKGRLPEAAGEVIISSMVMKNQKMQIGDWFRKDVFGETFRIVGEVESDIMVSAGMPNHHYNNGTYYVIQYDEASADLTAFFKEMGVELDAVDTVYDLPAHRKHFREDCDVLIANIMNAISAVVMFFVAVTMLIAYVSFMRNRVNEYCLYASIGYRRWEVYGMMMREMFIIFGIGFLLGIALALPSAVILKKAVLDPAGILSVAWYPEMIAKLGAIMLLILGLLQIPVLVTIRKIKTIDEIED